MSFWAQISYRHWLTSGPPLQLASGGDLELAKLQRVEDSSAISNMFVHEASLNVGPDLISGTTDFLLFMIVQPSLRKISLGLGQKRGGPHRKVGDFTFALAIM